MNTEHTGANQPPSRNHRNRRCHILSDRPMLGAYRLCAEIAHGGMATVFLADTPGHRVQQPVAIKRIHPHLAKDPTFVEMFYDEAVIASRIRHANVCHVFDHDLYDGEYFLVMEYLVGEPLSRIVKALQRKHDIDWRQHAFTVAAIIADAARGLHAAHELVDENGEPLDVVHRDISPDNVFLTFDGVVKVVDFGVASASRKLHRTATGMLKGKYAYLQPEVLAGGKADRRGDVWGLGVVLWELLVLQRLFNRATDFETLRAVNEAEIRSPASIVPELPEELCAIVMKILSREPSERYSTAKEVEQALRRFLASHGASTSSGSLSDWLNGIFPEGLARQRQFIDIALETPDDAPSSNSQRTRDSWLPTLAAHSHQPSSRPPQYGAPRNVTPPEAHSITGMMPEAPTLAAEMRPPQPSFADESFLQPPPAAGNVNRPLMPPQYAAFDGAEAGPPRVSGAAVMPPPRAPMPSYVPVPFERSRAMSFTTDDVTGSIEPTHFPTPSPRSDPAEPAIRRGARALPTALAGIALVVSIAGVWSLNSGSASGLFSHEASAAVATEAQGPHGAAAQRNAPNAPSDADEGATRGKGFGDDFASSHEGLSPSERARDVEIASDFEGKAGKVFLSTKAISLQLPDSLLSERRSAQSPPIELGQGSYRLALIPENGGWSVRIVPHDARDGVNEQQPVIGAGATQAPQQQHHQGQQASPQQPRAAEPQTPPQYHPKAPSQGTAPPREASEPDRAPSVGVFMPETP